MKKFSTLTACVIAVAAFATTACHSDQHHDKAKSNVSMGAMNDKCPISGKPVNKDVKTASFENHNIGFCCNGCPSQWDAMSKEQKEAWCAKNMK